MDDTISRAAALNCVYGTSPNKIKGRIAELPSVTDTNVGGNLIDRQAALYALGERPTVWTDDDDYALGERNQYDMDRLAIETVPSAQLAQDLTNGCTDTISRQAAIETVRKAQSIGQAHRMLVQLPSAQPGWIPIGAPMNSGQHYLVTLRQKFEGEETYRVRIMRFHEGHWLYPHHFPEWINDEMEQAVVAWMPLPTPYQEGDDKHEG